MIKLFDITIGQQEDILLEGTAGGDLLISATGSGTFSGSRISGKVLPVGMCTTYTPKSGLNLINAPVLLETDDGVKLLMKMEAYLHLPQELEDRMLAGESVDPDKYYYKGTVTFDVENSEYSWLENKVFVCEGVIENWQSLKFGVFEV